MSRKTETSRGGWLRGHMTFANVMSCLSLFVALSAGAYAAGLKKDSVGSKQIKAGAVKAPELANGAVGSEKLGASAVGSPNLGDAVVTTAKLGDGAVTSGKVAAGAIGADKLAPGLLAASCPAGMTRFGTGLCVDSVSRGAQSWFDAMNTCANAGLRLPSIGEIWLARSVASGGSAWTEAGYRESSGAADVNVAMALQNDGGLRIRIHGATAALSVFCATTPTAG